MKTQRIWDIWFGGRKNSADSRLEIYGKSTSLRPREVYGLRDAISERIRELEAAGFGEETGGPDMVLVPHGFVLWLIETCQDAGNTKPLRKRKGRCALCPVRTACNKSRRSIEEADHASE